MQTFNMTICSIDADFNAMENLARIRLLAIRGLVTSYPDFTTAYTPAAEWFITDYVNAFPTTSLLLTLYPVVPGDLGLTLQNDTAAWGKASFPVHFGTMVSALYATVPPHDPPPSPLCYPKGFQMVCRAVDDPARLYLDPDPVPMPPAPIPLQDALEHGVTLGAKYVEVYEEDLNPAISQPVLAAERVKLLANVGDGTDGGGSGPPAPPTGLHVVK